MSPLTNLNLNLTLLAIPAYHLLTLLPHALAIRLIAGRNIASYDNRNPRSGAYRQAAEKRMSAAKFSKWERLEACAANGFENAPLFYATVILGNLAGMHKEEGVNGLEFSVAVYMALRVLYTAVYAVNDNQGKSALRSVLWFAQVGVLYSVLVRAAGMLI